MSWAWKDEGFPQIEMERAGLRVLAVCERPMGRLEKAGDTQGTSSLEINPRLLPGTLGNFPGCL